MNNTILEKEIWEDAVALAIYYINGSILAKTPLKNDYYTAKLIGEDLRGGYDRNGNQMSNQACMREAWKIVKEANRRLGWY